MFLSSNKLMIFLWGLTFLNEFFMYLDPFFEYGSSFETLLWRIKKQFYISVFLMTIFLLKVFFIKLFIYSLLFL